MLKTTGFSFSELWPKSISIQGFRQATKNTGLKLAGVFVTNLSVENF
jgi:hypothetical protein